MIVVAGEALVDLTPAPVPGGSPLNVAVGLGRLGRHVRLATALGKDPYAELLRAHLAESSVEVDAVEVPRTSTAKVTVTQHGVADYAFDLLVDIPAIRDTSAIGWLHVGSLAAACPPAAGKVLALAERLHGEVPISFDPNLRRGFPVDRADVDRLVSLSTVTKLSVEDAALLDAATDPEQLARQWLSRGGPRLVVLTCGAGGAVAISDEGRIDVPAQPGNPVVDTIGAGDAFTAGLVHALLDGADHETAMHVASSVARRTCERRGADPPWPSVDGVLQARPRSGR